MDDLVPCYYVCTTFHRMPENARDAIVEWIKHALSLTPCVCAIYSDVYDAELSARLCPWIVRASDSRNAESMAMRLWLQVKMPSVVVGGAEILDAVFLGGARASIGGINGWLEKN